MEHIIHRDSYLNSLINKKENGLIKVITGIRRCGKSFRPLKSTKDFFKKIIVSKTTMKPWTDEDGILHLGLYEFLLNDGALEL